MFFDSLDEISRKALLAAHAYAELRKAKQRGYRIDIGNPEILTKPVFKQFKTVVKWLEEQGWNIAWTPEHWQGYFRFVFENSQTTPQPGQLKNKMLLKQYMTSIPDTDPGKAMDEKALQEMYQKKLRPEIRDNKSLLWKLGLI